MDKMGYQPGLIRYTTESELSGGTTHWLRPRSIGYAAALTIMIAAFGYALLTRVPFEVDVLRERGELYERLADGVIGNQYRLRLMNKTQRSATLTIRAESTPPVKLSQTKPVTLSPGELLDLPLTLSLPADTMSTPNIPVTIRICEQNAGRCDTEQTRFLGPTS
jgi:polyferredoxin